MDITQQFYHSRKMETFAALEVFSSLSQETRLNVFKLLIEYGADGLVAGKIAETLAIPDNTLSFHLSHMTRANIVTSQKQGRTVTYYANTGLTEDLIDFLRENCCVREEKNKSKNKKTTERKC